MVKYSTMMFAFILLGLVYCQPGDERKQFADLERIIGGVREKLRIPSLSAVVVENQKVVWSKGFGFQDPEKRIPASDHTTYHLASLTKTFASTILLQLIEKGKIKLDDPVSDYGIQLESKGVIRVRHLFSHTSEGMPGDAYKYSGNRFAELDKVVLKGAGKPFGEVVIKEILEPLELNESGPYMWPGATGRSELERLRFDKVLPNVAVPYQLQDGRDLKPGEYPQRFSVSAGLMSSVLDMARYDIAIDRNRFVSRETQQMAFTPTKSNSGAVLPYGLGWFTQNLKGEPIIWHYGYWVCNSSIIIKVPRMNLTFIAMANTDELSEPTDLGAGDVTSSPVGIQFLKLFVFPKILGNPVPEIDWQLPDDKLTAQLKSAGNASVAEVLQKEMIVETRMMRLLKRDSDAERLQRIFSSAFPSAEWKK